MRAWDAGYRGQRAQRAARFSSGFQRVRSARGKRQERGYANSSSLPAVRGFAPDTPRALTHSLPPSAGRPHKWGLAGLPKPGDRVAIYRCEIKTVSRSQGASAVAGAAYRAGLDLTDLRTGERHDYTRKNGVVASGILAPAGSPEWARDPAQLWNAAEAAETRKNSVVAREFLVSLPHELTDDQRADLARDLTTDLVKRFGFAAMFAIHAPDKNADERNHHVHILATTRRMEPTGLGAKTRELDDRKTGAVEEVRAKSGEYHQPAPGTCRLVRTRGPPQLAGPASGGGQRRGLCSGRRVGPPTGTQGGPHGDRHRPSGQTQPPRRTCPAGAHRERPAGPSPGRSLS
ncbi:hypothetical protein C7E24_20695 [Stenotrophomonas maltophilia]|nr:hypothetical protein C7E24_20695 [Stenotrophomonas maltophilia]